MCVPRSVLAWILGVVLLHPSSAAFGQFRLPADPLRDVEQTIQARRWLEADPELTGHNIAVTVRDRVAILWGPAPSAEMAFRAELCLRGMIELAEIRNQLFVSDLLEPRRRPFPLGKPARPTEYTPIAPNGPRATLEAPTPIEEPKVSAVLATLPPLTLPRPVGLFGRDEAAERDQRLTEAIRAALLSNESYRAVQFSVKEGRVSLHLPSGDRNLLHQAAQVVAHLPHVTGVLIEGPAKSQ